MDHREIGRNLDLFTFSDLSPGNPIWLPNGAFVYSALEEAMRDFNQRSGYHEVRTPLLFKPDLFKISGHWDFYKDNMFVVGDDEYVLKPMNCPGHMEIFRSRHWSYRDLPYRMSDMSVLHRNEVSGAVGGLTRCRSFCQDDAHIFLRENQLEAELDKMIKDASRVLKSFGFSFNIEVSTRPDNYLGTKELWDKAENVLKNVAGDCKICEKEGAFYGPKVDFFVVDSKSKEWQISTVQLDFQLPRNFDLKFTNENNVEEIPVVIHRAFFGSYERFIALLLEDCQGKLPFWLSPKQIAIIPVSEKHSVDSVLNALDYARLEILKEGTVSARVAQAQARAIPYSIVVGQKELDSKLFNLRSLDGNVRKDMSYLDLLTHYNEENFWRI